MRQRLFPIVGFLLATALAIFGNLATSAVNVTWPWWPGFLWAVVAILVIVSAIQYVLPNRVDAAAADREGLSAATSNLAKVTNQLAVAIQTQLEREEQLQSVHDPFPLPVRWHRAADNLTDHWANIRKAPAGSRPGPLHLEGSLEHIVAVYRRIPSARLVILGRTGSGKTMLARQFALDWIKNRKHDMPVATIFGLASWNNAT